MTTSYIIAATETSEQTSETAPAESTTTETTHIVGESEHAETSTHTTEDAGHSTEESEGIGALGLDVFAIAAQAFTFLLLLWLVKKFALDKIVANLDKRHNDIDRGLHLTSEMDKEKAALDERVEKVLKNARKEADLVITEAKVESGKIIQTAEESANKRAEEIMKTAEGKIASDISSARQELKGEMASLITEATEAILNQKLDSNSDRKLVEEYLKEAMK